MSDEPELDWAIQHATGRARDEQEELMAEPSDSPKVLPRAKAVQHLADDIGTLASDAAADAEGGQAEPDGVAEGSSDAEEADQHGQ